MLGFGGVLPPWAPSVRPSPCQRAQRRGCAADAPRLRAAGGRVAALPQAGGACGHCGVGAIHYGAGVYVARRRVMPRQCACVRSSARCSGICQRWRAFILGFWGLVVSHRVPVGGTPCSRGFWGFWCGAVAHPRMHLPCAPSRNFARPPPAASFPSVLA